jgi:hypothetical protein
MGNKTSGNKPIVHERKKRKRLSPRQAKFIHARAQGNSQAKSAIIAGYSSKNSDQTGHQVMEGLRGRVPDLLDRAGLSEETLIGKYLVPLLEWEETVFFQKDGRVKEERKVADGSIRHSALRTAFELHGSYAPKLLENKDSGGNVTVILDVPRPDHSKRNAPINVTPMNGNEPAKSNVSEPKKEIASGNGSKPDPRPKD